MNSDLDTIIEQEHRLIGNVKKAINKLSSFFSRYYQELIVSAYLPLTAAVTYNFERLNTGEASLPEHVSKGVVYSLLTYICMKSIKHEKELENALAHKKISKPKTALSYTGELSVIWWMAYNADNLASAVNRVMAAPHSESAFWQELLTYYSSTIALLSFPIYSLMRAVGNVIQNYASAARREVNLNMLSASLTSITGQCEKAIALCEHVEDIAPEYAEPNAIKAQCLEKKGEYGAVFIELRKAREKREHYELSQRVMKSNLYAEQLLTRIESWLKLRKIRAAAGKEGIDAQEGTAQRTELVLKMANVAYLFAARGLYGHALETFKEAIGLFPDNLELKVLYAEELTFKDDKESREAAVDVHKGIYQAIKDSKPYLLAGCGETTMPVSQIRGDSSPLLHHTYIYKTFSAEEHAASVRNLDAIIILHRQAVEELKSMVESREESNAEKASREDLEQRLKTMETLEFSEVLAEIRSDDKVVQIMKRGIGKTYRDTITNPFSPDEETLFGIASAMAFIHAKMPTSGRALRDQRSYFVKRLEQLGEMLGLVQNVVGVMQGGYVDDRMLDFDNVFNKDSHPENWILTTGFVPALAEQKMLAIDWDEKGLVHQPVELVNLLDNFLCLEFGLKKEVAGHYLREYRFFRGMPQPTHEETGRFVLSYLDSTFYRTIELCFAWSSPYRPTMHEHRKTLITNAINSVEMIGWHYHEFYRRYYPNYLAREMNLPKILDKI